MTDTAMIFITGQSSEGNNPFDCKLRKVPKKKLGIAKEN